MSLPWSIGGMCLPHVDPKDPETVFRGIQKRVCVKPPEAEPDLLKEITEYTQWFCEKYLIPLPPDTDLTEETWLAQTSYELWRKDELRKIGETIINRLDRDNFRVDGFVKDETYSDWKHARGINARKDAAKWITGPTFKAIEKEVFKLDYFIKKIPKPERAQYILDKIFTPGFVYVASDYTSYESHFVKSILEAIEFIMYKYMTQYLPNREEFWYILDNIIAGKNKIQFSFFNLEIEATRMTGEMNTSLGNGFSNLILLLFVYHKAGYSVEQVRAVIEGDDSLSAMDPTHSIDVDLFRRLGFTIKLEIFTNLNEASFCGSIFDVEDLVIITDIKEAMVSLGWTKSKYAKSKNKKLIGLLRAKAYSMLYEYCGCPILQSLAKRLIELTEGYRSVVESSNEYEREQNKQMLEYIKKNGLPYKPVPIRTRLLVEQLFNIPTYIQEALEEKIQKMTLGEFWSDELLMFSPDCWLHYYNIYTLSDVEFNQLAPFDLKQGIKFNEQFLENILK